MATSRSDGAFNGRATCSVCQKKIDIKEAYCHDAKVLCEDCCMDVRTRRGRKTHWQYIGSVKGQYLVPGKGR